MTNEIQELKVDSWPDFVQPEGEALALDAFAAEHEHDDEILDFSGSPQLDPSLKAPLEADAELLQQMHSIPPKMSFKIGEAAEMVGVKQYVLRYWESEFDNLRPRKSANGQRIYARKDVETAMMIKKLLYLDRFSIEGARSAFRQLKSAIKLSANAHMTADAKLPLSSSGTLSGTSSGTSPMTSPVTSPTSDASTAKTARSQAAAIRMLQSLISDIRLARASF